MRIKNYPSAPTVDTTDSLIIDGDSGVRSIPLKDLTTLLLDVQTQTQYYEVLDKFMSVGDRKQVYRGKNLGSVITDEQWEEIRTGHFHGLFLGDYWLINGISWRIADFDYFWNCSDTNLSRIEHITIFPDNHFGLHKFKSDGILNGGLLASDIYKENGVLDQIKNDYVIPVFGESHIMPYQDLISNAVSDTLKYPTNGIWKTLTLQIPNEASIYGTTRVAAMNSGVPDHIMSTATVMNEQFSLLKVDKGFINRRYTYWLKDFVDLYRTSVQYYYGCASDSIISNNNYVRIFFNIKG